MPRPELRPLRVVVVTGTGTEVGKTWVACRVAALTGAVVRKPAQSFDAADEGKTDADLLAAVTGDDPTAVCPAHRWYPKPMAPPMAAIALGRPPFTIADLAVETQWPERTSIGLAEGAGGVRSPIADDGDTADLARALGADMVVLVADAGLGTINTVRMSITALDGLRTVVYFNRFEADDDLHVRNRDWLATRDGLEVVTTIDDLAALLRS